MAYPENHDSSAERLKSFVERVERVTEEIDALKADVKEIFAEAKGTGFDVKIIREVIKRRKMEAHARSEHDELLDLYERSLGMLADTPLGRSALKRPTENETPPSDDTPAAPKAKKLREPRQPTEEERRTAAALEAKAALARMTVEEAKALGAVDHSAGKKVTDNPFAAKSKQRAAWDKAWCAADGSDGLSLPGEKKSDEGDDEA